MRLISHLIAYKVYECEHIGSELPATASHQPLQPAALLRPQGLTSTTSLAVGNYSCGFLLVYMATTSVASHA